MVLSCLLSSYSVLSMIILHLKFTHDYSFKFHPSVGANKTKNKEYKSIIAWNRYIIMSPYNTDLKKRFSTCNENRWTLAKIQNFHTKFRLNWLRLF